MLNSRVGKTGEVKLVSACLFGIDCRYDGESSFNEKVMEMSEGSVLIPVCPEQLGGLETPRDPITISSGDGSAVLGGTGKMTARKGRDLTDNLVKGAKETLKIAEAHNIEEAILKARSLSCGTGEIHKDELGLVEGDGVTAALLKRNGIRVVSEEEL